MKKIISSFVLMAIFTFVGTASASPLVNGGFETGDFTGWSTNTGGGIVSVVASDNEYGIPTFPTEGQYMAKIFGGGYNSLTQNWISQTFSVNNAQSLSFDYRVILPDYPPYEQPGFRVDLAQGGGMPYTIFSVNDPGHGTQVIGWDTYTYDLGGYSGDLTLTFMLGNTKDNLYSPSGTIDNVQVNPVPIQGAAWLLVSGLVGLVGLKWREKK